MAAPRRMSRVTRSALARHGERRTHQPGLGEEEGHRIKTGPADRQAVQYKNTQPHRELGPVQREGPEDPPVFPEKPIISPALTLYCFPPVCITAYDINLIFL